MWINELANLKTFARKESTNVKTHVTNNVGGVSYYKWLQSLVLEGGYTSSAGMDSSNKTHFKLFCEYYLNVKVWVTCLP